MNNCNYFQIFIMEDAPVFTIFNKSSPAVLGIDISKSSVKLVELCKSGASYRIASFAIESLPEGAFVEQMIIEENIVTEAIIRAVAKSKTRLKQVAIALSGAAVITKMIHLDGSLSDTELESQITVEADNFIPFDINEVMIDFEVQRKTPSGQSEVLVAVCRSETTDCYESVLGLANLNPKIVDVEIYALERAINFLVPAIGKDYKKKVLALVDVGAVSTNIYVFHKGEILYTREQAFGGDQLTEIIKHHCNVEVKEALEIQKGTSASKSVEPAIFNDFCKQCAQQIGQGLQFFYSTSGHDSVDHLVLSGGAAATQGLKAHVEQLLNIKSIVANPFEHMSIARKVNQKLLKANAPALMIACGLAMRSFD